MCRMFHRLLFLLTVFGLHVDMVQRSLVLFIPVEIDMPNIAGILLVDMNVWVLAVYRPPSYTVDQDDRLIRFLNEFNDGTEVIIVGDFNLPSLDWSSDNMLHGYVPPGEMLFFYCFSLLGLRRVHLLIQIMF